MQEKKGPIKRQIFVAIGLVLNERGEVLLGKRHDPRNRGMHGRWEFPGGKVEFGEHPSETVCREIKEEVALDIMDPKLMAVYSWFHPDRPHIQIVILAYIARVANTAVAKPNCSEVREVTWKSIDGAMQLPIIENNQYILRDLKKNV